MKRISIIAALLVLVPAVSQARHSQCYRVRYSPYAFDYHHSGLVPGMVKYSPYAFNAHSSGLVYKGTRYSPYAFSYHNSGLVTDRYWHSLPAWPPCGLPCPAPKCTTTIRRVAKRAAPPVHKVSAKQLQQIRETDGMDVIQQSLKERGVNNIQIDYRLSFENQTADVIFILRNEGLVIRYTNPEAMESLQAQSLARQTAIERYEERWETLAETFQNNGSAICCISTTDKDLMLAALDNCDELPLQPMTSDSATMYAKN